MNKYAAEKIASEYYNRGVQLALQNAGITKTASKGKALAALAALSGGTGAGLVGAEQQLLARMGLGGAGEKAKMLASSLLGEGGMASRLAGRAGNMEEAAIRAGMGPINPQMAHDIAATGKLPGIASAESNAINELFGMNMDQFGNML